MAQEVVIGGAMFSDVPSISVPDSNNVYHSFVDSSDADATAGDISSGKTAYVNGTKLTGTGNYVTIDTDQTVTGAKTFQNVVKIQNGQGTGSIWVGGNVNANTATNNQRHLARIVVPSYANVNLGATLLGYDTSGDSDANVSGKTYDVVSFGGMKKITNATSPMAIVFCVTSERAATAAAKKVYPLEMDATTARFNVQPNYNGNNLLTTATGVASVNGAHGDVTIPTLPSVTSTDNGKVLRVVSGAWAAVNLPSASGVSF